MRIKARALGLPAEDYFNDQVLEDRDLMYSGVFQLPPDFWPKHGKDMESWSDAKSGTMFYRVTGPNVSQMMVNQFVYQENTDGSTPFYAQVREINGKTALLQTLKDFSHQKNNVWSITARNREQNFAMNLLMNPDIDFVTLLGQAGTGKTLLALAAGLEQVLDSKRYNEIIITRATVPVGEDIGFLPGTEEEKMQPWMGAFDDNLEVLHRSDDGAGEFMGVGDRNAALHADRHHQVERQQLGDRAGDRQVGAGERQGGAEDEEQHHRRQDVLEGERGEGQDRRGDAREQVRAHPGERALGERRRRQDRRWRGAHEVAGDRLRHVSAPRAQCAGCRGP